MRRWLDSAVFFLSFMTTRFYRVDKTGSLKNLKPFNGSLDALTVGKVLVEVKCIGINYADIFAVMGLYSATPKTPFVPGLEFSGVVLESDAPNFVKGMRVMGITRFGGYSSHIESIPEDLLPIPDDWTFQEGAAYLVQTLTAYYALHTLGNLTPNQTVLIHSAAGGVGLIANRIAKLTKAFTIGVVGSPSKLQLLEAEGFDKAIVRDRRTFAQQLRSSLNGRDLNLVLEATGGKFFTESFKALAPMGRIVAYGSADFTPSGPSPNYLTLVWKYLTRPRVDPLSMIKANKSVMAFNLIWLYEHKALKKILLEQIESLRLSAPFVGHQYPFDQLPRALETMRTGATTGKVVVNL